MIQYGKSVVDYISTEQKSKSGRIEIDENIAKTDFCHAYTQSAT